MKKILAFLILNFSFLIPLFSQTNTYKCYPTNWWVGMKQDSLQIMIHGDKIADKFPMIKMKPNGIKLATGVSLIKLNRVENPNYIFLDLIIDATAKPCKFSFPFLKDIKIDYELKARRKGNGIAYAQGVTSKDFVYLIMPDRFSNGDPHNDKFSDMNDTLSDRNNPFLRHGGDLKGIINHLNYFNDLGVTALWLTPVIENNQALTIEDSTIRSAYHGYAFTDQYKIDKRFGGNEAYKQMIDSAHAHHLKIIQDAVYNHLGDKHFLYTDPPSKDCFHQFPAYTNTSYRDQPMVDKYASKSDINISNNGWFTKFLPDINQRYPYMENYLIQYAIWAVEEFGIDGWRVDTYFYSDRDFLNKINAVLYKEFPAITIFGENTMQSVTEQAYYAQNNIDTKWKSNLQGIIDFQWESAVHAALKEDFGWNTGVMQVYDLLVQDILYKDPMRNEILLDNHDQDRFYSVIGEDFNKYKQGIALLLTQRGVPQLYYGTEILMKNFKDPTDAEVRKDFPGGWAEDKENKFMASGRNEKENDAFNYIKSLADFRKTSSALQTGNTMQFLPKDGVYVYFRYDNNQTVMVAINTSKEEKKISIERFAERTNVFSQSLNIFTKNKSALKDFTIGSGEALVLELQK